MIRALRISIPLLFAAVLMAGGVSMVSFPASADDEGKGQESHAHDPTNIWNIARGGQLYDNWMAVIEADKPNATHPAYPKAGKKKGGSTWRCKECHGWDYMGKDGAYAKGSHYTGIKGVRAMVGRDANEIHDIIMDDTHAMKDKMPHSAMEKIVLFLSKGQVDNDKYIDRKNKAVRGNAKRGAAIFQTVCAVCHGFDGKEINFKSPPKAEFVGTVCTKNPWEGLHKIRFGQPGVGMVALAALGIDTAVDILSYCQTLPVK